jgi:hypothetical protein
VLVHDADSAQQRTPPLSGGRDDVFAVHDDAAAHRLQQPDLCLSSVLLPQPEPPSMTKTSPACTSKETSRSTTLWS